jgi:hypothetical protein
MKRPRRHASGPRPPCGHPTFSEAPPPGARGLAWAGLPTGPTRAAGRRRQGSPPPSPGSCRRGRAPATPTRPPPTAPPRLWAPAVAPRPLSPAVPQQPRASDAPPQPTSPAVPPRLVPPAVPPSPAAAGACRASATAGCGPEGDVTGCGLEASATPREPPLTATAVPTATRVALDKRRLVGTDAVDGENPST